MATTLEIRNTVSKDPTVDRYFEEHPEARAGVMKAFYAFNAGHYRAEELPVHNFTSAARLSQCVWCGRSREDVRYDDLPPECLKRPADADKSIAAVIYGEEERCFAIMDKAKTHIPKLLEKLGPLTGELLAVLHHTYGYPPEVVEDVVEVPKQLLEGYNTEMAAFSQKSRESRKITIIKAKIE